MENGLIAFSSGGNSTCSTYLLRIKERGPGLLSDVWSASHMRNTDGTGKKLYHLVRRGLILNGCGLYGSLISMIK